MVTRSAHDWDYSCAIALKAPFAAQVVIGLLILL